MITTKFDLFSEFQKQQRIDESLEQCMEENPEMFGTVIMLYIDCLINGHKIKAFVDSGPVKYKRTNDICLVMVKKRVFKFKRCSSSRKKTLEEFH